jgi:hypothetical protein
MDSALQACLLFIVQQDLLAGAWPDLSLLGLKPRQTLGLEL